MSQQGLTLIESLVAVIMIGVAISATIPPLFVATATRVQNRRVEQAMQLAQGEVDRTRTLVEQQQQQQQPENTRLIPQKADTLADGDPAQDYGPATTIATELLISPNSACHDPLQERREPIGPPIDAINPLIRVFPDANVLMPVDIDGQADGGGACDAEFLMQVFRVDNANTPAGTYFEVGVRVYAISAADNLDQLDTEVADLKFTTGTGSQTVRPLATLYSKVAKADSTRNSFCPFHDLANCPP